MDDINSFLANYRKSGEIIWFEKLYYHFMPKIYNYFYFRIEDKQISEDLASEVFIKVFKNIKTKKFNSRSFSVWIYKIAKNQLIDYFRKVNKEKQLIVFTDLKDSDNLQEDDFIEENFLIKNSVFLKKEFEFKDIKLSKAIEKLTQLQKSVLFLLFIVDFDYLTVADILNKKQSTIRGIIFRAINVLKSEIRNE